MGGDHAQSHDPVRGRLVRQRSHRPTGDGASAGEVTLTRIECGTGATPTDVGQRFTDTFAYKDLKLTFTFSRYLIKHGEEYMVWGHRLRPRHESQSAESWILREGVESAFSCLIVTVGVGITSCFDISDFRRSHHMVNARQLVQATSSRDPQFSQKTASAEF